MTPEIWALAPHFQSSEFDSPDLAGSGENMSAEFVVMMEALRRLIDKKCRINSGFRTPAHNKAVGGAPSSAHLTGEGADVRTTGWTKRERIDFIIYARKLGFNGIGIAPTYIHIDNKKRVASWRYVGGKTVPIPIGREAEFA